MYTGYGIYINQTPNSVCGEYHVICSLAGSTLFMLYQVADICRWSWHHRPALAQYIPFAGLGGFECFTNLVRLTPGSRAAALSIKSMLRPWAWSNHLSKAQSSAKLLFPTGYHRLGVWNALCILSTYVHFLRRTCYVPAASVGLRAGLLGLHAMSYSSKRFTTNLPFSRTNPW